MRNKYKRKLWVKAWMTLDGVYDAETMHAWWENSNSPARMDHITEQYRTGDIYLLGRKTYEMLWPGWSKMTTGEGPGPLLNRMHKYVVSTTLREAPWKESTIISENVVEQIANLKMQPGKDIIIGWEWDFSRVPVGYRSHRRVQVYRRAVRYGKGEAVLPGWDVTYEIEAYRKQNPRLRIACTRLCRRKLA